MRTKRIALKLDQEYRDKLSAIAKVHHRSMSAQLRVMIEKEFQKAMTAKWPIRN